MYKPYDPRMLALTRSEQIRILNDAFRTTVLPVGSTIGTDELVITRGVADRGADFIDRAVTAVRTFCDFTQDNDPFGEHDFGTFELDGVNLFWKIDCYDQDLDFGSPDPADPAVTRRVLTVLLAEEY
jgi:hypothetical protein